MPDDLSWFADSRAGHVVVTVSGTVDGRSAPGLHRALTRWVSGEPVALVAELSGASVADPEAARIFAAIVRQADVWPGTPVLLSGPDAASAALIAEAFGQAPPLFTTVADALATLARDHETITEVILPVRGAARRARDVVTGACAAWDLPHLTAPATLVVSELVSNGVMHAGSLMTLQVRRRPRYLYLAVYDDAPGEPAPRDPDAGDAPGGRGLRMVELAASRWGHRRERGGKVVWAAFAAAPGETHPLIT